MYEILILGVLWALLAPIVALRLAMRAEKRAQQALRRVADLEAGLAASPAARGPTPAAGPWAEAPAPEPAGPPSAASDETARAEDEPAAPQAGAVASEQPRESLETRIGARWSVLVGGLALALGAVFLVRYTIEQGILGPGARVVLGLLLSGALFAAGEWLRRRDLALRLPVFPAADIPGILTAAGGIAAFASIYAAHALYGFIGGASAFLLLTLAGLLTLVLSAVHGPALAAIGALGSYAAPLLVQSVEPNPLPVALHTIAVTAAVLGMARIRGWRWLAVGGVLASLAWGLLIGAIGHPYTTGTEVLLVLALAALFVAVFVVGALSTTLRDTPPDPYAVGALAGIVALALAYATTDPAYPALLMGLALVAVCGAAAARWPAVAPASLLAAIVAVATVMLIPSTATEGLELARLGRFEWYVLGTADMGRFALKAAAVALLAGLGALASADRAAPLAPWTAGVFAAAGAAAPLLILVVVYLRHFPFETRPAVGIAAVALAASYAAAAERLIARRPGDLAAPAPAAYAAGAVFALAFAAAVGIATRFIPIALSLAALGTIWVYRRRPVPALTWLAAAAAALAGLAILLGPAFTSEEIGTRPLVNGLVLSLGLPAAALLVAGEMLRRIRDGLPSGILQAIGLVVLALFTSLEIRHFVNDGDIASARFGLAEAGAQTLAALAFSLGLQRIGRKTENRVYDAASAVAGALGVAVIAFGLFVAANPLVTGEDIGRGAVFNLLLPGYLLPALMAGWVAVAGRAIRPPFFTRMMALLALALAFAWVTFEVRRAFHGPRLDGLTVLDSENYAYSAAWLAFGVALLLAGIVFRQTMLRAASGAVIALVVVKVFLFDMAALTGALRAASFLGLGLALIVIGRLYQRLLTRPPPASQPS